ncbi:MAG TPA: GNAT family N-acetyltransferase [Emcibacteraceae bacterium]|nr:GNAT family N-acetyltransferase [Emcibacteraceae bacterium]
MKSDSLSLRMAKKEDIISVFEWRNDPWLIPFSSSQKGVCWEDHELWFNKILSDNKSLIYIIEINNQGVGQIRFTQRDNKSCTISISMLKPFTGKGYGVLSLQRACQEIIKKWPMTEILAYVRSDNMQSMTAFEKAGFLKTENIKDVPEDHKCFSLRIK